VGKVSNSQNFVGTGFVVTVTVVVEELALVVEVLVEGCTSAARAGAAASK